jgi:hypothetical protein
MHKGWRVIRVVVQVGVVKMKISVAAAVEVLMKKERHDDETQFTTKNWLEKTIVWIPVISTFCKIFIPSYTFD